MYAVKATGTLRVSQEGELEGLDLHEHGAPAYPEFVTSFATSLGSGSERSLCDTVRPRSPVSSR